MKKQSLYRYLYNSFLCQLAVGTIRKGEQLPSIDALCYKYNVGANTVRKAMALMKKYGYISVDRGKRAIVIRDTATEEENLETIALIGRNKSVICSSFRAGAYLLPGLVAEGIRQCSPETLKELIDSIQSGSIQNDKATLLQAYRHLLWIPLSQLRNQVVNNLCRECFLFQQAHLLDLPLEVFKIKIRTFFSDFLLHVSDNDIAGIRASIQKFNLDMANSLQNDKGSIETCLPFLPSDHLFYWIEDSRSSKLYIHTALNLLNEIAAGRYPDDSFLPPLHAISEQYEISEITSRNAVKLLNALHVTRSINGVGTQVTTWRASRDSLPTELTAVRTCLLIFLQLFQALTLTCRDVYIAATPLIPQTELDTLFKEAHISDGTQIAPKYIMLHAVTKHLPPGILKNIYEQLLRLLYTGIIITFCRDWKEHLIYTKLDIIPAIEALKKQNYAECGKIMEELYIKSFHGIRQFMIANGLNEAAQVQILKIPNSL